MKSFRKLRHVAGAAILAGLATLGAPTSPQAADTIPILLCPLVVARWLVIQS
jgi:hypothetical protein